MLGRGQWLRGAVLLAVAGASVLVTTASPVSAQARPASTQPSSLVTQFGDPRATTGDAFGTAVSVSGDAAAVGAPAWNLPATVGQVYLYRYEGNANTWALVATLTDPGASHSDGFGTAVAISGNTLVVGAEGTAGGANTAYVYVNNGGGWPTTPTVVLTDPGGNPLDQFGAAVAVHGQKMVVGAPFAQASHGAAYYYAAVAGQWSATPTVTLTNPDTSGQGWGTPCSEFGGSVAVAYSSVAVGGRSQCAGVVYLYRPANGVISQRTRRALLDPDPAAFLFGSSLALAGHTLVVGSPGERGNAGEADVYTRVGGIWPVVPNVELTDPAGQAGDSFGSSVAASPGTTVVGADGTSANNGAAYLYTPSGGVWSNTPSGTLTSGTSAPDLFGDAVGVSGHNVVVGAPGATSSQGAAYFYLT